MFGVGQEDQTRIGPRASLGDSVEFALSSSAAFHRVRRTCAKSLLCTRVLSPSCDSSRPIMSSQFGTDPAIRLNQELPLRPRGVTAYGITGACSLRERVPRSTRVAAASVRLNITGKARRAFELQDKG